jgi:hypothetical protein
LTGAASTTALLLLALAGGFLFAYSCKHTKYPSARGEGQQLYFFAAVFAVLLLAYSRGAIALAASIALRPWEEWFGGVMKDLAGPLYSPMLSTFVLAFILGPVMAWSVNWWSDGSKIADNVIDEYGEELEKFLYESTRDQSLVYIALDNRKVYVGWAIDMPLPKPRRDAPKDYFTLLPAKSGYLAEDTLKPHFTTFYGPVHDQIADGTITDLSLEDFQIVVPLDRMVVARPYSLDVDPSLFEAFPDRPTRTRQSGLFGTLLTLLIVWRITRRPTRD